MSSKPTKAFKRRQREAKRKQALPKQILHEDVHPPTPSSTPISSPRREPCVTPPSSRSSSSDDLMLREYKARTTAFKVPSDLLRASYAYQTLMKQLWASRSFCPRFNDGTCPYSREQCVWINRTLHPTQPCLYFFFQKLYKECSREWLHPLDLPLLQRHEEGCTNNHCTFSHRFELMAALQWFQNQEYLKRPDVWLARFKADSKDEETSGDDQD